MSYNQPKFCPNTFWNSNAVIFAGINTVSSGPQDIFINTNNTVYVAARGNNRVLVWFEGSINVSTIISTNVTLPYSLFVTEIGDIYIYNHYTNYGIKKWTLNATFGVSILYSINICYSVFVDIMNIIYCSMADNHQVIAKSLSNASSTSTIMAGIDCPGALSNMLYSPKGIFVDINFDLYVADCGNDRVQLFRSGQRNGTTLAGATAKGTITLNCPYDVVLDADNYLFIVDSNNHRIIGSGPDGFRCIIGCFGYGSALNQLYYPQSMAFDSYGNIFVIDTSNNRVQKFIVSRNSCSKYCHIYSNNKSKALFHFQTHTY